MHLLLYRLYIVTVKFQHYCMSSYLIHQTFSGSDGIEYTLQCPCNTSFAFFENFSIRFAKAAEGTIFFIGSDVNSEGPFKVNSSFSKLEIPYLRPGVVNAAVSIIVHTMLPSNGEFY